MCTKVCFWISFLQSSLKSDQIDSKTKGELIHSKRCTQQSASRHQSLKLDVEVRVWEGATEGIVWVGLRGRSVGFRRKKQCFLPTLCTA